MAYKLLVQNDVLVFFTLNGKEVFSVLAPVIDRIGCYQQLFYGFLPSAAYFGESAI
jgi:hypothetical protein